MTKTTTVIARMKELVCPLCGSDKIVTTRGVIIKHGNFQECKCTHCNGDFFVSSTVLQKE